MPPTSRVAVFMPRSSHSCRPTFPLSLCKRSRGPSGRAEAVSLRAKRTPTTGYRVCLVLVLDRASVPVDLQPLHKRVVDGDDVGGDRPVVAFELPDLQTFVIQALKLQAEIAAHVLRRQVHERPDARSEQSA